MVERTLIFNTKGLQLGYIEGNAAFDLSGTQRCSYTGATGNLSDLNNGKVVGHVSLDGTFVGASWVSEDLFGKPSGEPRADHLTRAAGPHRGLNRLETPPQTRVPHRLVAAAVAGGHTISTEHPEAGLNAAGELADRMDALPSAPHVEPPPEAPGPTTASAAENELFDRAIGMIRSALEKGGSNA
jgi:hypothetical protein